MAKITPTKVGRAKGGRPYAWTTATGKPSSEEHLKTGGHKSRRRGDFSWVSPVETQHPVFKNRHQYPKGTPVRGI